MGNKQISVMIPEEWYEQVKKIGLKWSQVVREGLMYREQEYQLRTLEAANKDLKERINRLEKANMIMQQQILQEGGNNGTI